MAGSISHHGRFDKYLSDFSALADITSSGELSESANTRMSRYRANWRTYYGADRFDAQRVRGQNDGKTEAQTNLTRTTVDRMLAFAFGHRWKETLEYDPTLELDEKGEPTGEVSVEEKNRRNELTKLLQYCHKVYYKHNPGDVIRHETGLNGAVCGDIFWYVSPVVDGSLYAEFDKVTNEVTANRRGMRIRVLAVSPSYCHVVKGPDGRECSWALVRWPIDHMEMEGGEARKKTYIFEQEITAAKVKERVRDSKGRVIEEDEYDNPIKKVFVVHAKNYSVPGTYGMDDVYAVRGIVHEMDDKIDNVSEIIDYHAAPTTIVKGARVSNLERGANKVWSGLPANSEVFNLELNGDLAATNKHLEMLKELVQTTTGVNEAALGTSLNISNTSGVALHMRFYPLLSVALLKWTPYIDGIEQVYDLILRWGDWTGGMKNSAEERLQFMEALTIVMKPNLPKDELVEIQKAREKLSGGLDSPTEILKELGNRDPAGTIEAFETFLEEHPGYANLLGVVKGQEAQRPGSDKDPDDNTRVDGDDDPGITGSTGTNISGLRNPTEANPGTR